MALFATLRKNALLTAMLVGTLLYELFALVPFLQPVGDEVGPILPDLLPVGLFTLLYCTFCKIRLSELQPRTWHFVIQAIRVTLSGSLVLMILALDNGWLPITIGEGRAEACKLILEGMFICFICPTASAVVVVAEKLGGSIGSLTIFTIIANMVTMVIIPVFFPLVEREAHITFLMAMLMLLRSVTLVLVVPLVLAQLTRRFLPAVSNKLNTCKNIGFYIWCFNLAVVTGLTVRNIQHSTVSGWVLWMLLITPLFVCLVQFAIGKAVGRHWGDSISAGQALGQKNTVVGIWLTLTFLNPLAAVAPGAYVLWQNLVNSWQLWYRQKHGYLIW